MFMKNKVNIASGNNNIFNWNMFLIVYLFDLLWHPRKAKVFVKASFDVFWPIIIGFLTPVVITLAYFYVNGAISDFLMAAFLQNSTYVSVGSGAFSKLSNPLFVKGVILGVTSVVLILLYLRKKISKELLFLGLWFGFSIFGALISNRPYMHYLLQIVPPGTLLFFYLVSSIKKNFVFLGFFVMVCYVLFTNFQGAFHLHAVPYYKNFLEFASERKLWNDYVSFFDRKALDSYKLSEYVKTHSNPGETIFIWDDAASVYYLSDRKPATKFIQAHHLTTVGAENYDLVIDQLAYSDPKLILIKKDGRFKFPKLMDFVHRNYQERRVISGLEIFER